MRKKTKFKYRILSFLIMALMMLNVLATPTSVLAAEIYEAIAASQKVSDAPTSLDDIKIPTVSKNPYDVNVYVETYPIYNDAIYNRLNSYTNAVNGYEIHRIQPEGHSPYYTASIGSWYDYQFWKDGYDDMQITSNLPYREGRDSIFKYESGRNSQMLHSELTLKNGGITVRPINDLSSLSYSSYKEILTDYITNNVGLNKDQVYLRASTMLLSGKGGIWATYVGDENDSYSTSARADADGAKRLSLDVPLSRATTWTTIYFDADSYYNEPDSIMTDFSLTLIDNTAPQVSSITVEREVREDYSADLILTMKFNEKIRFANEDVKNELDNIWVELELLDLSSGKKDTVRLYLEKLENGSLVFRGDIGLYNYKNFRVNRIKKANLPNEWRSISIGVIDLADEMYKGAYETVDYNNEIITVDVIDSLDLKATTTPICDLAGNAINTASITNWSFGDQSYISNTFEAVDVKLYNQNTIGLALGEKTEGEAERADMIVGPSSELYVYVYLNQHLTKEEAEKVYIELNILDENGNPVKARATSSSDYTVDEMYADGTLTGTVLKFENIKFKQGMSLDLEEGEDVEPLIKVAKMTDEIDGKTAYANVVEPSRKMYADFTPPEVTYEYYAMNTEEPDYTASISISVEDIVNYSQIAGLLGTTAYVSIGGGVEKDTRVKYILTENAIPPEEKSGYTNELTLKKNAMSPIGTFTILNATTKTYLHLLIESDELFIDDLFIAVEAEDIVGNISEIDPPETIEYMVDEIAPETEYVTQSAQVLNQNTQIEMSWSVYAHDRNNIDRFLYYFGDEYTGAEGEAAPEWLPLVITPGNEAEAVIKKTYGGLGEGSDVIHTDTLWIKAIDEYGNESEPIAKYITVSLEKPSTNAKFEGDITAVSDHHKITVTGADPALLDGADAYTRVTLTPIDNKEYSYVTLVKTGETVDVLSFKGRTWYRVKLGTDSYTEVSAGEIVTDDYTLTEDSVLYGLFTYYGDLKVSFENGYGDMTPRVGYVYDMANAGSYAYDPNYFVVRYASPYNKDITVNNIDFGNIIDKDGAVVVSDADYGNSPYKYNASRKGINPMRNSQIHFTVSNAIRSDYGILDFDYESSYMEFIRAGENGEDDVVVSKQTGLAASASQYYSIPSYTDSGESFITGAYYLRVTLLSKNGSVNIHESSRVVLDAQTADNAGVWKYSYQTRYNLEAVTSDTYSWVDKIAEGEPFDTIGVSVSIGGEKMRSSVFAVYSYGVWGLGLIISTPDTVGSYEGVEVGKVSGYKMWNMLSEPTRQEVEGQGFQRDLSISNGNYFLSRYPDLDNIYTEENIPKGADGFGELYLVKGVNTVCYQVKMENGYVSPVKQFTIIVTDYTPELNIAIDNYDPSHQTSQIDGVINAHSIRFLVETAYSLNGTGNVRVDLWSDYGMNVGSLVDGEINEAFIDDPTPLSYSLGVLKTGMKVDEYADFTQNSYTSDFPKYNMLCTALFIATDEYGGVTIVAPQIGDHIRYGTNTGSQLDSEYNINYYGGYFGDPYTIGDSFLAWRIAYNQVQYFGKDVLGFENYLYENTENGDSLYEITMKSNPELKYNLFNIVTNDIKWSAPSQSSSDGYSYTHVMFEYGDNFDLIKWDGATITFSGGDLGDESVTLSLAGEDNEIGYMGAYVSEENGLSLGIANPRATAENPAGKEVTRNYTIDCHNIYGDRYQTSATVTLYYIDYGIKNVSMKENGAEVSLSFETAEYGSLVKTGIFKNGTYSFEATDLYGNKLTYVYDVTDSADNDTTIELSKTDKTAKPVTVTLSRDNEDIFVDINDYAVMSVENNGTKSVTVTVSENTRFSYRYIRDGEEVMRYISVNNISKSSPYLVWDYDKDAVNEDDEGNRYRYGSVTVYLADENFTIRDKYTGETPSFTFNPGENTSYTFSREDIELILGDEVIELENDITAMLDLTLYEIPDPIGKATEDNETPNVQLLAYSNLNGVYSETKLALQLENARNSNALVDRTGYKSFEFVGNRADTGELLQYLGWATSYRFIIESVDMSKTKLFIKEGLYAEAPDYETGVSDVIDGVELNSKLLSITKNAKFSLIVVDASNNSSSIAFNVTDIGDAPSPKIVKVQTDSEHIRAYIIPPEASTEFDIIGLDTVKTDLDKDSDYYGKLYIEYTDNDEYIVNYQMVYGGARITGAVDISVDEIRLSEIALMTNGIQWSTNKAFEATDKQVSAMIYLTETVTEIRCGEYDKSKVSFLVSGNTVSVTYSDNHPAIEFDCVASNGTYVTVRLDAVSNIDKSAPVIEVVSKELASNGKSLLLTLRTDERTVIADGGYAGEEREDGKYYYERVFKDNGEYTFKFVDMTGITAEITISITELVLDELSALYSLSSDGSASVSDPASLDVKIGDKVYVNPLRDVTAELSDGSQISLESGVWTQITVSDALGGVRPYIVMTDIYGNVLTHQFSKVHIPDTTAPEVIINKGIYSVREGTPRETVEKELLANLAAFDNESEELTLSVSFTEDLSVIGVTEVAYTATDEAGNTATKYAKLRITSIYEPIVYIGDKKLSRDDGIVLSADEEINLNIDCSGLNFRVIIKEGIKTQAQMKVGTTEVASYSLNGDVSLGKLDAGIYTVCIINQNRDYFRILISVE